VLANTTSHPIGLKIKKATGCYLIDDSDKEYLDFIAGISVNNLGHSVQEINEAIIKQLEKHTHVMVYGEYEQDSVTQFSKTLTSLLPQSLNTVYPLNSGTEAIEAALKIAKRYTGRSKIISFTGAYHGNTHGSMSVSSNEQKKTAFRPLLPGIEFLKWNSIEELDKIDEESSCVILETIQGDAGVRIPSNEFMIALRDKCSSVSALLILDEIQCGYGRSGQFSAFSQFGIIPDILCLGKALGAGFPIGAVVSSKIILDCIQNNPSLGHITTFGGNPVICAAANAGLERYKSLENSLEIEEKGLLVQNLVSKHPKVTAFRRSGLMIGINLETADQVSELILKCREKGLLLFWFLSVPNGFRISPPLVISKKEIRKGCSIIIETLNELV
tara:strand:- start:249 stop:1409 length:1161 start_codon:yes stop_codon:yes gene_type:complete